MHAGKVRSLFSDQFRPFPRRVPLSVTLDGACTINEHMAVTKIVS